FVDENVNFDFAAYQQQLRNPEADWSAVEALARERIPMIKLNAYLMSQVHVSQDEVREVYEEENTLITVRYVTFPLDDEDISGYTPSDEEIQDYYEQHADDFRRGEMAVVDYVKIPIEPTAQDLDDLMYTARTLSDQIAAGEDFAEIARAYSQASTANVGGETGFITASQRDSDVMTRVAIMNEGQVSDPIQTKDGIYLVKLIGKKQDDGETKYNIQELFLRLEAGRETIDSLMTLARDVRELAVEKGLAKAAADSGLTVETTEPFQANFPIAGLGFVPSVSRFAFNHDPGTISDVINDEDNYYIVDVSERIPASVRPLEEVRSIVDERMRYERRKSMARRKAEGFHRKLTTTDATLEETAEDYGRVVHSPEPFRFVDPLDDMPPRSPFAYAALRIQENTWSPPVESAGAYVVFQLLDRSPVDEEAFIQRAPAIAQRLRQEKVRAYVTYWYEKLKENAKIEDYRGSA
ncbi:MAG: peptidyl-prolyl cis-trans isomerase, partial [Candidatus Latescibacterota bacterium]